MLCPVAVMKMITNTKNTRHGKPRCVFLRGIFEQLIQRCGFELFHPVDDEPDKGIAHGKNPELQGNSGGFIRAEAASVAF